MAKTIGAGLVDETDDHPGVVAAALIGAIAWNLITWRLGLPSSSSHALIGGLLGRHVVGARASARSRSTGIVDKVLIPLVSSPVAGFLLAFLLMVALYWLFRRRPTGGRCARGFRRLQMLLGGVHGVRPRLERRPEDDGHHHARAVQRRRHPERSRSRCG